MRDRVGEGDALSVAVVGSELNRVDDGKSERLRVGHLNALAIIRDDLDAILVPVGDGDLAARRGLDASGAEGDIIGSAACKESTMSAEETSR